MVEIYCPAVFLVEAVLPHVDAGEACDVVEEGIRRLWAKNLVAVFSEQLETVPIRNACARSNDDVIGRDLQSSIVLSDGFACRPLTEGIRSIYARGFSGFLEYLGESLCGI